MNSPMPVQKEPDDFAMMQDLVFIMANRIFPDREPSKAFLKLFEELGEVIKKPRDRLEWADVFIMLLDLSKMFGIDDLQQAIFDKMSILEKREWVETETGTYQHTKCAGIGVEEWWLTKEGWV